MEPKPTPHNVSDKDLEQLFETLPDEELEELPTRNHRLARIQEFEESALQRSDSYAAVIGVGNADVARILEHYSAAILDRLDGQVAKLDDFHELEKPLQLFLRLKQTLALDLALDRGSVELSSSKSPSRKARGISLRAKSHGQKLPRHWMADGR